MDTIVAPEAVTFGSFRFDRRGKTLLCRSEGGDFIQVPIGSRALDVLAVLVARPGILVSKEELMRSVWPGTVVEEANLAVQISNLRRALDAGSTDTSCIQTVPGRGYRLTLTVVPVAGAERPTPELSTDRPLPGTRTVRRARLCLSVTGLTIILAVAAAGWSGLHRPARKPHDPGRFAIVVMPLTNLSGDQDQGWFVDAITNNLTTDLSRIAGLSVIAYSTAATYRDKPIDARQVGSDLGVGYVLEGSVQRLSGSVEVNARLVDAHNGMLIWADRFDTAFHDLWRTEAEITGRLAFTFNSQLVSAAARAGDQASNVAPEASELIMRGWAAWYRPFSVANRKEAQDDFERALEKAPNSIEARIGVSTILVTNIGTGLSRDANADAARVEQLIREALEVDPSSSSAHTVLGSLRRWQNRLDEARSEEEIAVTLDRNNAHALLQLGQALMFLGQPDAAIPFVEAANQLNPRDPNAAWSDWTLGVCHLLRGETETATRLLRQARNRNPRVYYFQLYLAGALGLHGDVEEARTAFSEAARLNPPAASFTGWRAAQPWITHPAYWAMIEKTAAIGLRKAGMPD